MRKKIITLTCLCTFIANLSMARASICQANMVDVPHEAKSILFRKGYISNKNSNVKISITHEKIETIVYTKYEDDTPLYINFGSEEPNQAEIKTYYDKYEQVLSVSVDGVIVQQRSSVYKHKSGFLDEISEESTKRLAKKVYSPKKMKRKFNACDLLN